MLLPGDGGSIFAVLRQTAGLAPFSGADDSDVSLALLSNVRRQ
jgi:hypothetical protein